MIQSRQGAREGRTDASLGLSSLEVSWSLHVSHGLPRTKEFWGQRVFSADTGRSQANWDGCLPKVPGNDHEVILSLGNRAVLSPPTSSC
jgi:hypothetical protein